MNSHRIVLTSRSALALTQAFDCMFICFKYLLHTWRPKQTSKTKFPTPFRKTHMPENDDAPSPGGLPGPLRLRSPEVASTSRFEDKDEEERRQKLGSQGTVQVVNVALLVCSALLRRMLVRADPRAGGRADETAAQAVQRHAGIMFTRAHARYFFEVVAAALRIPEEVLTAVVGRHNPPGSSDDGAGLVLVEKLLHGALPGCKAPTAGGTVEGLGNVFTLTPTTSAVYGPLISPTEDDGPITWRLTRRSLPTNAYPAALLVGTIEGGRAATLGGCYATGYLVDLSKISFQFVAAILVAIADGSSRRGGGGWDILPASIDYPAALLASDPCGPQPSIEVMAQDIIEKSKVFFAMYKAGVLESGSSSDTQGVAKMSRGNPGSLSTTVAEASADMAAGKESVAGRLLPPFAQLPLHELYDQLRRRDVLRTDRFQKPHGDDADGNGDDGHGALAEESRRLEISNRAIVSLDTVTRGALKRKISEDALLPADSRMKWCAEKLGLVPFFPTRARMQGFVEDVAEQAIAATLAGAVATGQAEMQRLVTALQEQLRTTTVQRDAAKAKKQEYLKLYNQCMQDLQQTREDLVGAKANAQAVPSMGATDPSIFQVQLSNERDAFRDLQRENDELKRNHTNAILLKESLEFQLQALQVKSRVENDTMSNKLATMESKLESREAKL